jgi:hypothetical protein
MKERHMYKLIKNGRVIAKIDATISLSDLGFLTTLGYIIIKLKEYV